VPDTLCHTHHPGAFGGDRRDGHDRKLQVVRYCFLSVSKQNALKDADVSGPKFLENGGPWRSPDFPDRLLM